MPRVLELVEAGGVGEHGVVVVAGDEVGVVWGPVWGGEGGRGEGWGRRWGRVGRCGEGRGGVSAGHGEWLGMAIVEKG